MLQFLGCSRLGLGLGAIMFMYRTARGLGPEHGLWNTQLQPPAEQHTPGDVLCTERRSCAQADGSGVENEF